MGRLGGRLALEECREDVRRREDVVLELAEVARIRQRPEALVVRVAVAPATPLACHWERIGVLVGRRGYSIPWKTEMDEPHLAAHLEEEGYG